MENKVGYKRIILAVFFILATVMLQILAVKAQEAENPLCEEHFGHPCSPSARPCCAHTGRQCVATSSNGFRCQ
ncbi:unnamed protein product [Amaranthus hypochondriacus]